MLSFQSPQAWGYQVSSHGMDGFQGRNHHSKKKRKRDASPVKAAVKKLLKGALKYTAHKAKPEMSYEGTSDAETASPKITDSKGVEVAGGSISSVVPALAAVGPEMVIPALAGAAVLSLTEAVTPKLANYLMNGLERAVTGVEDLIIRGVDSVIGKSPTQNEESEVTTTVVPTEMDTVRPPMASRTASTRVYGGSATIPKLELDQIEKRRIRRLAGKRGSVEDFIKFLAKNYARKINKDHLASVLSVGAKNLLDVYDSPSAAGDVIDKLSIALVTKWPEVVEGIQGPQGQSKNSKVKGGAFGIPLVKRKLSEKQIAALARGRELRKSRIAAKNEQ